jgi:hypothetical protein
MPACEKDAGLARGPALVQGLAEPVTSVAIVAPALPTRWIE